LIEELWVTDKEVEFAIWVRPSILFRVPPQLQQQEKPAACSSRISSAMTGMPTGREGEMVMDFMQLLGQPMDASVRYVIHATLNKRHRGPLVWRVMLPKGFDSALHRRGMQSPVHLERGVELCAKRVEARQYFPSIALYSSVLKVTLSKQLSRYQARSSMALSMESSGNKAPLHFDAIGSSLGIGCIASLTIMPYP